MPDCETTRSNFPDPIPKIFPFGSIATLAGATGTGKTALISGWIARWQKGQSICGQPPAESPPPLGILTGDRAWADHQQWFDLAGCIHAIPHYSIRDDAAFNWDELRFWQQVPKVFADAVDRVGLPPGGLLIVDPLALFISGNLSDYKQVAVSLGGLSQILQRRQLTTLGIFHTAKQRMGPDDRYLRPQDRILGSTAQQGFSDTPMYLMAPDELGESYYGFGWNPHHAPAQTFSFMRNEVGLFVPFDALEDVSNIERVYACVPEDGAIISFTVLLALAFKECQIKRSMACRYVDKLLKDGRIIRAAKGQYRRVQPA